MAQKTYEQMLETIGNMTVLELSDFVKALEEKFDVKAAMPVAAAAPAAGAAAPAAAEKSEYKVTLKKVGDKMAAIKALRAVKPGLGLVEVKKMVEEAPTVLAEAASKEEAAKMKEALVAAGAEVELS
jgi:large subunit ribosomal protein L7/L12